MHLLHYVILQLFHTEILRNGFKTCTNLKFILILYMFGAVLQEKSAMYIYSPAVSQVFTTCLSSVTKAYL